MNAATFDRDYTLAELLPAGLLAGVGGALARLLAADMAVLDAGGNALWGRAPTEAGRQPLVLELEPIGYLAAVAPPDRLQAAANLLRQMLQARNRYLMASNLHTESVSASYATLLAKHEALQESEARYRALSEQLEQRVAEQVKLLDERARQLYQAEKLASVGQLAAGVAHEINNPIGFVRSNIATFGGYLDKFGALKERLADASAAWVALDLDFLLADGADLVKDSIGGIDRVARIVRDLKGFSNVDRPEKEVVDLNDNLREVVSVGKGQLPAGVTLSLEEGVLPRLFCLPGQLNQVFFNVIRNAAQAVADCGRPGSVAMASRSVVDGIEIVVRDNGVGMTSEQAERAFDPFYTNRPVGQGMGLGLTVARDIVQAHGGRITIASEPGAGTAVTIFLPV